MGLVMSVRVRRVALALIACAVGGGMAGPWGVALGQQKPKEAPKPKEVAAQAELPVQQYVDICSGVTGVNASDKVTACTDAIKTGKLTGGELALVYLNRGLSDSGKGSDVR